MMSATGAFATTQVDQLLHRLEQAMGGLHVINGEMIEFSRESPKVAHYILNRLLHIADKFAGAHEAGDQSASLPWSVALSSIVNLHGDKAAQMERIEQSILRYAKADHGDTESGQGAELAEMWMLELKTRQSVSRANPLRPA